MKKLTLLILSVICVAAGSFAQTSQLAPDQNPQYLQSQNKYLAIADSVTKWHTITFQNTYKAYDYLEAKAERKAADRKFKQQLRLERARNSRYFNYYDPYYNQYNHWYSPYNSWPYRRWHRW